MIKDLTENQYKILKSLENDEMCYYYSYIEKETKLSREVLEKEVKTLRKAGLVLYVRGLMTDEGEVAGSGFSATGDGWDLVHKYEKTHHNWIEHCSCIYCKVKKCTICFEEKDKPNGNS